jgi:glycosyltransferase involved in cell wall biosynthesis
LGFSLGFGVEARLTLILLAGRGKGMEKSMHAATGISLGETSALIVPRQLEPERAQAKASAESTQCGVRVSAPGKFFEVGGRKWFLKGLTYGPFAPRWCPHSETDEYLPAEKRLREDLQEIRQLGANCIRLYHLPGRWFLDLAWEQELRVFVDVPWEKHRCFFEDWGSRKAALDSVERVARELADHPGLFAISVANELPSDIVRFYGRRRVGAFLNELIDSAKQIAPDCLVSFANYPSTEFLEVSNQDFCYFNVYLDDPDRLGAYLDRLQHLAGSLPLIVGEHGADSLRGSEWAQQSVVTQQVERIFRHGLAGSFVFSFTDDWYTGGHQIEDWAFGVTRADRTEKPLATSLRRSWIAAPRLCRDALPSVSVVVCSYNGAKLLRECLGSLLEVEYPNFEIILVDDGSTDETPSIAAEYSEIRYIRQDNLGLSVARNVGAEAARGEIVCYTDSDCVADKDWLYYLVDTMQRLGVDAIGGPNLPPPSDEWTARCVAASPGGPSHVMIDDRFAEHVPGCNMAFRRKTLLEMGGFDAQFRQAGDDVDICWRFLDAGMNIGFAPAAIVWHHRRNTVRAFLRQQKGYGRSEAMLTFKHPRRFNALGQSRWKGIIYGEGAVGLARATPLTYHGRHGSGLFQVIYARNDYKVSAYFTLLEWHVLAVFVAILSLLWHPLALVWGAMVGATLWTAARAAFSAPLASPAPLWCRPVVFALHILQPIVRAWHRYRQRMVQKCASVAELPGESVRWKRISMNTADAYWTSSQGFGREELLHAVEHRARAIGWQGIFHDEWKAWDIRLLAGRWHTLTLRSATEKLGDSKCFTRLRCTVRLTRFTRGVLLGLVILGIAAVVRRQPIAVGISAAALMLVFAAIQWSRRRCWGVGAQLLATAGRDAGLSVFAGEQPAFRAEVPVTDDFSELMPVACGGSDT